MLTTLRASNFRSWRDTKEIKLAPLTAFFGANSSGKSSIAKSVLMLKQTVESQDRKRALDFGDVDTYVDLGSYQESVYRHDLELSLGFELGWLDSNLSSDAKARNAFGLTDGHPVPIRFSTSIREFRNQPTVEEFMYHIGQRSIGMRRQAYSSERYELVQEHFKAKRVPGRPLIISAPIKCYGFPSEALLSYQNIDFISDLPLSLEQELLNIAYVGPLRNEPERVYFWSGDRPVNVGVQGAQAIPALLAARAEKMMTGRGRGRKQIEVKISEWLIEMGLVHSFTLRPIARNRKEYELQIRTTHGGAEANITDVGFGFSQILPALVQCYYAPPGSTIFLEQPELHLHPSAQSVLADMFIDVIHQQKVQLVIETHSERILRRLQRRIAEGSLSRADHALYYCSLPDEQSEITRLNVDDSGFIKNWPEHFFGDELADLKAITAAVKKRNEAQTAAKSK